MVNDEDEYKTMFYNMDAERLTSINQITEFAEATRDKFSVDLENPHISSNYKFDSITSITIQTMRKNKTRAGSYCPLPEQLKAKRAIVNIKTKDIQVVDNAKEMIEKLKAKERELLDNMKLFA